MSELGAVLDVAIGLIFLYMMTSLLVTIVQEGIATMMHLRAKNLFDAIVNLVDDPELKKHPEYRDLVVDLYRHPLMSSLYRHARPTEKGAARERLRRSPLPSYVPGRTFAIALLDVLRGKNASDAVGINTVLAGAQGTVAKLPESQLKRTLILLIADAESRGKSVDQRAHAVSDRIEEWFNDAMGRASGWYKRQAQQISLGLGFAIAVLLNANTLHVAEQLWRDQSLRAQVSATAAAYYKEQVDTRPLGDGDVKGANRESVAARWNSQMERLETSTLPIGWPMNVEAALPQSARGWGALVFGWLLTGLAASLGAVFWFDVLGKALQIRGTGARIAERAPSPRERDGAAEPQPLAIASATAQRGDATTSATIAVAQGERD
jgi:hypothetical protein